MLHRVPCLRSTLILACLYVTGPLQASPVKASPVKASPVEAGAVQADLKQAERVQAGTGAAAGDPADDNGARVSFPTVDRKPVWEFGVGGGYFAGFDYPASNDANRRFLALPFFIYRSPQFRIGDGGVRAVAIENPRVKLDLSLGASLNASSEGNSVREGMPDLDFLFEIGPQLEVRLLDRSLRSGGRLQLRFSSEIRAVLATDFSSVNGQGFVVETGLGLNVRNVRRTGIDLVTGFDVTYASEHLQDYFYEVDPPFVTSQRAAYDASGGYLGSTLLAGASVRPRKDLRLFLGVFTGLYGGAANRDSPLFETTSSTGFALALVWTIKASDAYVDIVDMGGNQ